MVPGFQQNDRMRPCNLESAFSYLWLTRDKMASVITLKVSEPTGF